MALAPDYPSQPYELGDYPPYGFELAEKYKDYWRCPPVLRSDVTSCYYVGVPDERGNRAFWHLAGPRAGREGVVLAGEASGLVHPPFKAAWHESPWTVGAVPGHVSWAKRPMNLGVYVGTDPRPKTVAAAGGRLERIVAANSPERYRLVHRAWWDSWSAERDGTIGFFTRARGFFWLPVRLESEPKTALSKDPVAYGNNGYVSDLPIVAADPFFKKLPRITTWRNNESTSTPLELVEEIIGNLVPGLDVGEGKLVVRNDGDQPAWPEYLVDSGAGGYVWLQDGDRMVRLPKLYQSDGAVLVTTDPAERTLTASNDPVDVAFLGLLKRSQILDFVLSGLLEPTEPLWRRGSDVFFTTPIPPRTTVTLTVRASNANATVSVKVPQQYNNPGL